MNKFFKGLLGAGLYLLEQSELASKTAREQAANRFEDMRDAAEDRFRTAARRVSKASRAIQGKDPSPLSTFLLFTAGLGVGIGAGLLLAPASGEEVRSAVSGKVQEFAGKFRAPDKSYSTGTQG